MTNLRFTLFLFIVLFQIQSVLSQNEKLIINENQKNDEKVLALGEFIENSIIESKPSSFMSKFDTKSFKNRISNKTIR